MPVTTSTRDAKGAPPPVSVARSPRAPQATVVCFVRHGSTPTTGKVLPGRAPGLHLSDQGRAEAAAAGGRLSGLGSVRALYCSPLERTRETAAALGEALGLEAVVEPGLLECDFGEWTGAELGVLARSSAWPIVQRHPSGFRFPGGESFVELEARMAAVVETMCLRHPGETVVAVSHADPIKVALCAALGTPLDLLQRIVVSPCSISAVAYAPERPSVLVVNSTGDLRSAGLARAPVSRRRR